MESGSFVQKTDINDVNPPERESERLPHFLFTNDDE
jgi:hypothetical protein